VASGGGARWATVSGQRRSQLSADPLDGRKNPMGTIVKSDDQLTGASELPANTLASDFWKWAYGDLSDDDVKGAFAEWLVAKLLALPQSRRVSWAPTDRKRAV
jgi:hypothetical protein